MTPISRTLNVMAYQARSRRKRKKTTVVNFANFDFPLDVLPHLEVLQLGASNFQPQVSLGKRTIAL